MDNVTAKELAHLKFFEQIQDSGTLKTNLQSAYTSDEANYLHQNQSEPKFSRLRLLGQLLANDAIDLLLSQLQVGTIQPIVNLSLSSAFLSWWDPSLSFNKPLDNFVQKFLSNVDEWILDVIRRIETKFKLKKSFSELMENFTTLRRIGQAIHTLAKKVRANKFKSFSEDDQWKLIRDCFHEAFKKYKIDNNLPYDKETVEQLLQQYFT